MPTVNVVILYLNRKYYIEKNCIQSIHCFMSRCSKTAKITCHKL